MIADNEMSQLNLIRSVRHEKMPSNHHVPGWNSRIENTVKEIGEKSKSYKMMHLKMAQRTSKKYTGYMTLGIVTGPVAGVISGVGAVLPDSYVLISILVAILGFISGVIVALMKFGQYDQVSLANKIAAAKYTSLESNVRRQLSLYREDRVSASRYLSWISNSFDELYIAAPLIPTDIYVKYASRADEGGITIPEQYEEHVRIDTENEIRKKQTFTDCSEIKITCQENTDSSSRKSTSKPVVSLVKRSAVLSQIPELDKYSDGAMQYEIQGMAELK